MKNQMWLDSLAEFDGFPNIVCGWPAEEIGAGRGDYESMIADALEGAYEDPPEFPDYETWRDAKIEEHGEDLGFSHMPCDLCGSHLAGERYAATALPKNPAENRDYIALRVCQDCLMWLANGELPFDE